MLFNDTNQREKTSVWDQHFGYAPQSPHLEVICPYNKALNPSQDLSNTPNFWSVVLYCNYVIRRQKTQPAALTSDDFIKRKDNSASKFENSLYAIFIYIFFL